MKKERRRKRGKKEEKKWEKREEKIGERCLKLSHYYILCKLFIHKLA